MTPGFKPFTVLTERYNIIFKVNENGRNNQVILIFQPFFHVCRLPFAVLNAGRPVFTLVNCVSINF